MEEEQFTLVWKDWLKGVVLVQALKHHIQKLRPVGPRLDHETQIHLHVQMFLSPALFLAPLRQDPHLGLEGPGGTPCSQIQRWAPAPR